MEISAVYGSYNKNFLNLYEEIIFRFSLKLYFKMKNGISGFLKVTFYYLNLIKEVKINMLCTFFFYMNGGKK